MSWWSPSLETPKQQVSGDIMEFIRQKQGSKMQDSKRIRLDAHSIKALPSTPKVQIMRDSGLAHCEESDDSDHELSGSAGEHFPGETIFNSLSSTDLNLFKFTPKLRKSGELFRSASNEESPTGNLAALKTMATPSNKNFTVSTENNSPRDTKYCDLGIESPIVKNYFKPRPQSNDNLERYKVDKEQSSTSDQSNTTNRQDNSSTSLPFPPLRDPTTGSETASPGSVSTVNAKVVPLRQIQNSNQFIDSSTVCSNNLKGAANQEPSTEIKGNFIDFSSHAKVPPKVPEYLNNNAGYNGEKEFIPPSNAIFHSSPVKEDLQADQGPKGIESSPILISCSALLKYNAFSAENELNEEDFELHEVKYSN